MGESLRNKKQENHGPRLTLGGLQPQHPMRGRTKECNAQQHGTRVVSKDESTSKRAEKHMQQSLCIRFSTLCNPVRCIRILPDVASETSPAVVLHLFLDCDHRQPAWLACSAVAAVARCTHAFPQLKVLCLQRLPPGFDVFVCICCCVVFVCVLALGFFSSFSFQAAPCVA
jgi:hypothetical protein